MITGFDLEQTGERACDLYVHRLERLERDLDTNGLEIGRVRAPRSLSTEKYVEGAACSLQIARLEKDLTGEWALSDKFVPPLIRIGRNPFLLLELTRIENLLQGFQPMLGSQASDSFLSASSAFAVRRTLVEAQRLMALVANLRRGVQSHPYYPVEGLRGFCLELCSLHGIRPQHGTEPYDHEGLSELVGRFIQVLEDGLARVRKKAAYYRFKQDGGFFVREPLPGVLREATGVYLLIQRPHMRVPVSLDRVKVSHRARLPYKVPIQSPTVKGSREVLGVAGRDGSSYTQ